MSEIQNELETGTTDEGHEVEERQCYICLDVAEGEACRWVSPCRCTGTMAWVHQDCVLRWIREQEQHVATPACAQCRTVFVLTPEKGPLLSGLDLLYKRVVPVCKYMAGCSISVIAFDSACAAMGIFTLTQAYGVDETVAMIAAYEDPTEATASLHLISYILMFLSYLPWEDCLLRVLRRSSRLPVFRAFLPSDAPLRFHEIPRKQTVNRVIADAVMLPVFANVIGTLFFSSDRSRLYRLMTGGLVYLSVKCVLYMYLNQKLLMRRHNMQILPVQEPHES